VKAIRRFTVRTVLPEPLLPLRELAQNLRWSWQPEHRELLRSVDPAGWQACGGEPVRLLASVPAGRLAALARDRAFLRRLDAAVEELREYLTAPRWYQGADPGRLPSAIAYFSPEYGITAALPQYSGGLGILAGDHLKAASDLGVPLIGVGLLYARGYFRQSLTHDGWQMEHYPVLDPGEAPLTLLRDEHGAPARVTLALPGGRSLHARIWKAMVGRVPLLLLDSDVPDNQRPERDVTDRLYGGGGDHRLLQEMLLGIGGVRAVRRYCALSGHPEPEVFHTNEGHAGFLGLERINELAAAGLDFDAALETVRAGTVFTTHTPVPAGIDRFGRDLVGRHFGVEGELPGVDAERVLALGAETYEGGDPAMFNMAVMGLRLAQRANGVSTLHGAVSRRMFAGLWPGFDPEEVPIGSITNGVHAPTWIASDVLRAGTGQLGAQRTEDALSLGGAHRWEAVRDIPDAVIWKLRRTLREQLVGEARARVRASWRQRGADDLELEWTGDVLDPDVLTIGFARRVPSYKRLTLMLRDRERLTALLLHPERPVQIVVAGKAHPADEGGKRLVQELVRFADDPAVRHRIVFLPDYDIAMAQRLLPGCDVWLNNPLRPLEACGTSGMKAALNGGLNLSVLDGWWDEWYDGDNGWSIPTADGASGERTEPGEDEHRDDIEAAALYDLIETRVAPRFYDTDRSGLPRRWIEMVRHTLVTLGPKVLAGRMVRDYVEELYAPAALAHRALDPATARELSGWKAKIRRQWPSVAVESVDAGSPSGTVELGASLGLRVQVSLGELEPGDVDVQVVCGRVDDSDRITEPSRASLKPAGARPASDGRWLYEGSLALDRSGPFGYTVRVLPAHPLLASPADLALVALPAEAGDPGR
jgi:glycogen phosphorylase